MPSIRNKYTWIPLYVLLAFLILKNDKRNCIVLAICCVLAIVVSDSVLCNFIKNMIQRTRPCNVDQLATHMHLLLKNCSGGFSFPSAHAANHATLAMLFGHYFYQPKKNIYIILLFVLWALLIAFAQVYVGVHYPSDVIAGFILGILNGLFFFYLYTKFTAYFNSK